jgi:hypothetical protein
VLRALIYERVFENSTVKVQSQYRVLSAPNCQQQLNGQVPRKAPWTASLSLLGVSRLLYHEAKPIAYTLCEFDLTCITIPRLACLAGIVR